MACQLASSAQRTLSRLPGDIALALATPPNRPPPPVASYLQPGGLPRPSRSGLGHTQGREAAGESFALGRKQRREA